VTVSPVGTRQDSRLAVGLCAVGAVATARQCRSTTATAIHSRSRLLSVAVVAVLLALVLPRGRSSRRRWNGSPHQRWFSR
jgi:hypothetical protein